MKKTIFVFGLALLLCYSRVFGTMPDKVFAPYVDVTLWPTFELMTAFEATGQRYFTLAFIVSNSSGAPSWGSYYDMDDEFMSDQIAELREAGGDIIISFGGASGTPIASAITSTESLVEAYESVIETYDVTWIDFDIEGSWVQDDASIERRNDAAALLQEEYPDLRITYCLPVMPTGLTTDGVAIIEDALDAGVDIYGVNVMAMDYGQSNDDMGGAAISAAESTYEQTGINIGITPMIGQNDTQNEIFSLDDAAELLSFAQSTSWVNMLAMWSMGRDNGDCAGTTTASATCSGVTQDEFQFTSVFYPYSSDSEDDVSNEDSDDNSENSDSGEDDNSDSDTADSNTTSNHAKEIIGYVTQWDAWKSTSAGLPSAGSLTQLNIDYSQYTILNFSFFGVANDGSLHSGDYRNQSIYLEDEEQEPADIFCTDVYSSWDLYILFGQLDLTYYISSDIAETAAEQGFEVEEGGSTWSNPTWGIYDKDLPLPLHTEGGAGGLIELAHENGVKAMASIGGWSMCKHFPETAADADMRANFIEGCKTLINVGFDGIDIDWEYPGYGGMNFEGSEEDFENFTTLLQEVRDAIGDDKLLTVAMSAAPSKLEGFEWDKLVDIVDYFNMMTYDFNGGWSDIAGHNAPLYEYDGAEEPDFNWQSTLNKLSEEDVPSEMVNMGCPFYGRGVICDGTAALNAATVKTSVTIQPDGPISTCADYTNWPLDVYDGTPNYYYIVQQTGLGTTNDWTRYWDDQAKVPYMTNGEYFLSYDDEESIELKAQYIVDNNLGGTIIWNAFGDLEISGTGTSYGSKLIQYSDVTSVLVNTINEVFATDSASSGDEVNDDEDTDDNTGNDDSDEEDNSDNDTSDPDTTDTCWTEWTSGAYTGGSQVSYNGVNYQAKWWTNGVPGEDDVWEDMGECDGSDSEEEESTTTCWTDWTDGAYTGGSLVSYNGVNYQAKWWTNGVPGEDDVWENMGSCSQTATTEASISSTLNTTGTLETASNNISVYPNPVNGTLYIDGLTPNALIEIYNIAGIKVKESHLSTISVSDLKSGMYIVKIIDNNQLAKKVIIKE